MTSAESYKENKFTDLLLNSKDLLFLEFNKKGEILFANDALNKVLGWDLNKTGKLKVSAIFDFRISEIERILNEKEDYFCEINLINTNKEFIPSKTKFIVNDGSILVLSTPLYDIYEEKKSSLQLNKTLNVIKELLNKPPDDENDIFSLIFDRISKLIKYNQGIIFLLEGNSLIIKAKDNINLANKDYTKAIFEKDKTITKIIREKTSILEKKNFSLPDELGINLPGNTVSILAAPLSIREMVYGIVVLISDDVVFTQNDQKILEAVISAVSYIIKDTELTAVFKMQLNVLKDNIKERTKTLELIKEQNEKILEADRIKNEFLANMSHELRTPLNAIIGFSEALSLNIFGELNEKQAEYVNDINASGLHLLGMINDLLDLSKIESGKMELNTSTFDILEAILEANNLIKPLAEKKNIKIILNLGNNSIETTADRRKFHQILYNILSNAIKFTPDNGEITVTLRDNKDDIEISIKDNGIGIPTEYHAKIFEKFHQVNNAFSKKTGSTGLGLTITKELIDMHGGKITVESEEGNGATFTVTLPKSLSLKP